MSLDEKAPERGRARKSSSKTRPIFLHFSSNNSFPENILLQLIEAKMYLLTILI